MEMQRSAFGCLFGRWNKPWSIVWKSHLRISSYPRGFICGRFRCRWRNGYLGANTVFSMARHYLGCKRGTISIREKRIDKAKRLLRNALDHQCKSARELATIVGSIMSMSPVLGRLLSIMIRHCQITLAITENWDTKHELDNYCLSELQFWHESLWLMLLILL